MHLTNSIRSIIAFNKRKGGKEIQPLPGQISPSGMFDFTNQVVIVTGSGSKRGLGRATALAFAQHGAAVVVADISDDGVKDTVAAIEAEGGKALGVHLDVTDQSSVDAMVQTVMDSFGRIDVLVNNAGISQKKTVADMTVEEMKRIFEINMFGLFRCSKAVMGIMQQQKYGRIVNLSSAAGKRGGGFLGGAHYAASKAAVLGFSKCMAREVAVDGVTVNCVAPGLINTDIWKKDLSEEEVANIIKSIPVGHPGEPYSVAAAILLLASKEADYITGEDIDINGGSHMD